MSPDDRTSPAFAVVRLYRWRPRAWRWLLAGVVAVAAPKCLVCVAGYAFVFAGVGLAGPELCGGPVDQDLLSAGGFMVVGIAVFAGLAAAWLLKAPGCPLRRRGDS